MVGPADLRKDLETKRPFFLAALRHERVERRYAIVLLRRGDIDMGDHVNRLRPAFDRCSRDCHAGMQPVIDRADEVRLDLLSKILRWSGRNMSLVGFRILPDRYDKELVLRSNALEDFEALIALILADCLRELLEQTSSRRSRARRDLDVTHGIESSVLRLVKALCRSGRCRCHGKKSYRQDRCYHALVLSCFALR